VDEANLHPAGHEIGEAPHDRLEECPVRIFRVAGLGVVPVDRVIGKAAQVLRIAARREILKRARKWLDATRVSTPPGSTRSRMTLSPLRIAANDRVVGIPSAAMASLTTYSRNTGPSAARPSPRRENRVGPDPLSWRS
jgi:hypothetical protein